MTLPKPIPNWTLPWLRLLLVALVVVGCARSRPPSSGGALEGPKKASIDIYRTRPGGDKIYVEADLGDGQPHYFLVDTGSSVSVLSEELTQNLGLKVRDLEGRLVGLGGDVPWRRTVVDEVNLGPFQMEQVAFAVGVPGVPTRAGLVPCAGILGNNIWRRFRMVVDYPASRLELSQPEPQLTPTDVGMPMYFNGQHVLTPAVFITEHNGQRLRQELLLEVDTGARGLIVSGPGGLKMEDAATEGLEAIFGVGAGDDLPLSNFLRQTRRLYLTHLEVGGKSLERELQVTWINFDAQRKRLGPVGMPGLLGHTILDGHRVLFDYAGQRFALMPPEGEARELDIHEHALERLGRSREPADLLERARLEAVLDRLDVSERLLEQYLLRSPEDSRGRALYVRVLRQQGRFDEANEQLAMMSPTQLVESGEAVGAVNTLWLMNRPEGALSLARELTAVAPNQAQAWVALSDAEQRNGNHRGARHAMREANRLDENPDGHLLRRAWISMDEGDLYGTITHTQRLLDLYPTGGVAALFYAQTVQGLPEQEMLQHDLERLQSRLHPGDGPLDFLAAAYHRLGAIEVARHLMEEGRTRDCLAAPNEPSRRNCEAWYLALVGADLDTAQDHIDQAVGPQPNRSEYLDTLATVLEARGDIAQARDAAWRAATISPDDVYLLWQASRLDARLRSGQGG
jgi:tetratricopeptide (TPR) repeat protein